MERILCLLALVAAVSCLPASAQFIHINLSVKVIRNPVGGTRPPGASDPEIEACVAGANRALASYQRGYRFRLKEPPIPVGGADQIGGPSAYYNSTFDWQNILGFEDDAEGNASYRWDNNAVNIYVNAGMGSTGIAMPEVLASLGFPGDVVIIGSGAIGVADQSQGHVLLHEVGHHLNLCHTHGCGCNECGECIPQIPGFPVNDDDVTDTLFDSQCWTDINQASQYHYSRNTTALSPAELESILNIWENAMSYHPEAHRNRMTEIQLDRWTDKANGTRRGSVTGTTRFVDWRNGCDNPTGASSCSPFSNGGPFTRVRDGVNAAHPAGIDIVMIRPGSYNKQFSINKRVTLRATRQGAVTIGR